MGIHYLSYLSITGLCGGDFNTILLSDDRLYGIPVSQSEVKDFTDCMQNNELFGVNTTGNYYTWCNNQDGEDRIYSKIDRMIEQATGELTRYSFLG